MTDYLIYPSGNRYYTGAEKKKSVMVNSKPYIIKFQKNSREGLRYNHISEYLGSHIFILLGVEAQTTYIGKYGNDNVVAMIDFLNDNETFVPFNGVGDSSLDEDKERFQYSYNDIIDMLKANTKLTDVDETINCFWDMFIVDALIANFDRHGSNWGFIKKDNFYRMAPVFDNGSCLFPQLNTDDKIDEILSSPDKMDERVYKFPTSQVKYNGKKSSYYEIIHSLEFEECNNALARITPKVDLDAINKIITKTPGISDKRKEFYRAIIKERFNKILLSSYSQLK